VCEAPVVRFDDWATNLARMDVVKIDVEGSELDVLRGMSASLDRLRPRVVAVETYEPHLAAAGTSEAEIVELLGDLGYVRERTIGHNAVFRLRGQDAAPAPTALRRERASLPRGLRPVLYPAVASVVVLAWVAKTISPQYDPIWRAFGDRWGAWTFVAPATVLIAWIVALTVVAIVRTDDVRALAGFVPDCFVLVGALLTDRRVPRRRRLLLVFLLVYLLMPIDPIPDVIPIVGQLDDVLVFTLVLRRVLGAVGEPIVRQHWPGPEASLRLVMRLATV
jgi:uncharacterized membrane protein YkvA (DUF1232 family)